MTDLRPIYFNEARARLVGNRLQRPLPVTLVRNRPLMSKNKKTKKPTVATSVEYIISYTDDDGRDARLVFTSRDAMREVLRDLKAAEVTDKYHTSKVTTVRTVTNVS